MIATTHLAVGAASGLAVQGLISPDASGTAKVLVAFAAGLVSHLVLDAIPHREYNVNGLTLWTVLSLEVATVFLFVLSLHNKLLLNLVIFAGMTGGALPDFVELAYQYFLQWPVLANLGQIIHFFHFCQTPSGFTLNYYWQVLIAVIAVIFVKNKST